MNQLRGRRSRPDTSRLPLRCSRCRSCRRCHIGSPCFPPRRAPSCCRCSRCKVRRWSRGTCSEEDMRSRPPRFGRSEKGWCWSRTCLSRGNSLRDSSRRCTSQNRRPNHRPSRQRTHQQRHQPNHRPSRQRTHPPSHQPRHQPRHQPSRQPNHQLLIRHLLIRRSPIHHSPIRQQPIHHQSPDSPSAPASRDSDPRSHRASTPRRWPCRA